MKIITFDIEEWAVAKSEGYGSVKLYAEFDHFLGKILDTLDASGIKGTFFCTGLMGESFPQVVRLIQSRGHEIGCHSHLHTWMNKLTETEAREDTHKSVEALEQCIGQKVFCYRAPAFSVGENNKWLFEILAENGITHDASVYPTTRNFGGFPNFGAKVPCYIEQGGVRLKEFPMCMATVFGKDMAYSGGGYFRFFPLWFVKNCMAKAEYSICYFHIGDLLPETSGVPTKEYYEAYYKEPGTWKNRHMRYIKTNIGKKSAFGKLQKLIKATDFINIEQADRMINWDGVPSIIL